VFCSNAFDLGDDGAVSSVTILDTVGVALPRDGSVTGELTTGSASGAAITATCVIGGATEAASGASTMNVLREAKEVNVTFPTLADTETGGQIGIEKKYWPFVQLYTYPQVET
jgi:hypothetical protein